MSRIFGMYSKTDNDLLGVCFRNLVNFFTQNTTLKSNSAGISNTTLGKCDFSKPRILKDEDNLLVMDGYIYNKEELGNSDELKLIKSFYKKYGFEETIKQFNGDFSIALYDKGKNILWLARDRFGVKPFYYTNNKNYFSFASNPKALLTLPGIQTKPNKQFVAIFAVSHYRYFDNDIDQSPYENIMQLPPAHILKVDNGKVTKKKYWELKDLPEFDLSEVDLAEKYKELLLDSVSLRLRASKNPVFTLSGGMDSSSVLACAVKLTGQKQSAISTVYDDKTYDESEEIASMLESNVKEWTKVNINDVDFFYLINKMINIHGEPVATATWLSHFLLCDKAKDLGFKSIFGGLGGDELNAGEYEHYVYHFADLKFKGKQKDLLYEVKNWVKHHDHPIFKKSSEIMETALANLVNLKSEGVCLPDIKRLCRYTKALNPEFFEFKKFKPVMDHPFKEYLKNRTYQDLTRETIPCCLRAEDRQTTEFGLDNFLPFLDHRLVEFMFRIPGTLKFRNGISKHLLRTAMKDIIPEETRIRIKKTGWNAPAHLWFSQGEGYRQLLELVNSKEFKERGIYNLPEVHRIIRENKEIVDSGANKENHMMFLWQLVNLELWLRSLE